MAKTAIIISISSDIGAALAMHWLDQGWTVLGTYRSQSATIERLAAAGIALVNCDVADPESLELGCLSLQKLCSSWDVLVIAHGSTEPIGPFILTDFNVWAHAIDINFTSQLRVTHALLPSRSKQDDLTPCVIYFAGSGTNSAAENYSAYTVAKIGLIKMCELLDAEIPTVRFTILGPGWVKTKIHDETLHAGERAGKNLARTKEKLAQNDFTPMEKVLECCDWLIMQPREVIGGRNFSVVNDKWNTRALHQALVADTDMYKLRRAGNQWVAGLPSLFF